MMTRRPQRGPRDSHRAHGRLVQVHAAADAVAQDPHAVLLYQDEGRLADAIAAWAEAGLRAGEGVVLVARTHLTAAVRERLHEMGLAPATLEATQQLRVLDADATLRLFMVRGQPNPNLFLNAVAPVLDAVRAASPAGEVRAWGEMVNLLVQRAQAPAATALEGLWSDLQAQQPFHLLCTYQVDPFDALQFPKVRAVAATHGLLLPTEEPDRFAAAVDAAFAETYGPEAPLVRAFLGSPAGSVPPALHHLLALHGLVPAFGDLVAARAGRHYRGGAA